MQRKVSIHIGVQQTIYLQISICRTRPTHTNGGLVVAVTVDKDRAIEGKVRSKWLAPISDNVTLIQDLVGNDLVPFVVGHCKQAIVG